MSFNVEKLPGEPVIITTINEDYVLTTELAQSNRAAMDLLEASDEPLFLIVDIHTSLDFEEVMTGANSEMWLHPNIRQTILVTPDPTVHMAVQGMTTAAFGNLNIVAFDTLDAALKHVRA